MQVIGYASQWLLYCYATGATDASLTVIPTVIQCVLYSSHDEMNTEKGGKGRGDVLTSVLVLL